MVVEENPESLAQGLARSRAHAEPDLTSARGRRRARCVLVLVLALLLVAQTALTPYLPQLFDRLYGIDDPGATGFYVWVCRLTAFAALPLWGMAARWVPLHRLIFVGLCSSAALVLMLGLAPSYSMYTAISVAVVASDSALLLAYPALVATYDRTEDEARPGRGAKTVSSADQESRRVAGVRLVVAAFHLSVVAATAVGSAVLALPEPRIGISALAVLYLVLAALVWRLLEPLSSGVKGTRFRPPGQNRARRLPIGRRSWRPIRRRWRSLSLLLLHVSLLGFAFDFSANVVRPFFTLYAEGFVSGSAMAGVLFFLPSLSALAVLPLASGLNHRLGRWCGPAAMLLGGAGLVWQTLASDVLQLSCGRLLFGVGLGLGHVVVDLRMFRASGAAGPAFSAVTTVRAVAMLAAPAVASAAFSHHSALPLAVGAVALVAAALAAGGGSSKPGTSEQPTTGIARSDGQPAR